MKARFVVREASGPKWDWIPEDWFVIDTERQVRVGAYERQNEALTACAELNEQWATR